MEIISLVLSIVSLALAVVGCGVQAGLPPLGVEAAARAPDEGREPAGRVGLARLATVVVVVVVEHHEEDRGHASSWPRSMWPARRGRSSAMSRLSWE